MTKEKMAIATIAWARNKEEEKRLQASLTSLASLRLPVFITDGGSSDAFREFLLSLPQFTVFTAKGLWPQAKKSITEAAKWGAQSILYTEPDKHLFFQDHFSTLLEQVVIDEKTGVVIASRSAKGFASFPPFQQMTETTINNCCAEVIGQKADYCYGPFLFNTKLIPSLEAITENCGWGWRPFLFTMAHRMGLAVRIMEGDFYCPPDQCLEDATERLYRIKQLTQNLEGLIQAASLPLS